MLSVTEIDKFHIHFLVSKEMYFLWKPLSHGFWFDERKPVTGTRGEVFSLPAIRRYLHVTDIPQVLVSKYQFVVTECLTRFRTDQYSILLYFEIDNGTNIYHTRNSEIARNWVSELLLENIFKVSLHINRDSCSAGIVLFEPVRRGYITPGSLYPELIIDNEGKFSVEGSYL